MTSHDSQIGASGAERRAGTLRANSACSTALLSIRSRYLLILHCRQAACCRCGSAGIVGSHHDHRLQLTLLIVNRVLACNQMVRLLLRYSTTVHEATTTTRRQRGATSSCLHERVLVIAHNFASCRVHKCWWLSHLTRALLLKRRRGSITHGLAHVHSIVL